MDEFKNIIISIIIFICWSAGCFFGGYLFCNRQATERINKANQELTRQQQEYERIIEGTRAELSNIRGQLSAKVSDNGTATKELSRIVDEIRKQKLDI